MSTNTITNRQVYLQLSLLLFFGDDNQIAGAVFKEQDCCFSEDKIIFIWQL